MGGSSRSAMPAASTSSDAATASSRPTRRAMRGASGAKAPKQSTGSVVSSPAIAGDRPVSARRSPSSGATATTAGRWFSATATTAATNSSAAQRERVVPWPSILVSSPHPAQPPDPAPAGPPEGGGGGGRPIVGSDPGHPP